MKNVQEYRIGNLGFGKWEDYDENTHYSICRVTGVSENQDIGEGWYYSLENLETKDVENYFDFEPIEITEEWLLKFGFEKEAECNLFKNIFQRGIIHAYTNNNEVSIELGNKGGYSFGYPKVKTVHQLQNLYFALTREELTVKEEK